MKKILLLVVIMILLGGCLDESKDPLNRAKAEWVCDKRGGLYSFRTGVIRNTFAVVTCNDGSTKSYTREHFTRLRGKGVLRYMPKKEATVAVPQYNIKDVK